MKIRTLIIILVVLGISNSIKAQTSLYEFDYRFVNDTTEYKVFLVRNEDATGFLRVSFLNHADRSRTIIDMNLFEHFDDHANGIPDTTILCFECRDPKIILGHADTKFEADFFRFRKNDKSGMFEPMEVDLFDPKTRKGVRANVTEMQLLDQKDLTKELVRQYFLENEDFFVNLFKTTTRHVTDDNARLFLLLVANTRDASIGKTCIVDKEAITDTYKAVAEFLEIPFVPKEISDTAFSKKNVETALNELKPGSNDIVVFYYTGHGFCDTTDNRLFPYLDLRDKKFQRPGPDFSLNMEDIYKIIRAKGAHLNLVFSDCCNSPIGTAPVHADKVPSTRVSSLGWVKNNAQTIFLESGQFSLLMTAASKKEESSGNDNEGGIFTFNLRETMEKFLGPQHTNISWDQILGTAQSQTIKRISRGLCPVAEDPTKFQDCKQRPLFKLN